MQRCSHRFSMFIMFYTRPANVDDVKIDDGFTENHCIRKIYLSATKAQKNRRNTDEISIVNTFNDLFKFLLFQISLVETLIVILRV